MTETEGQYRVSRRPALQRWAGIALLLLLLALSSITSLDRYAEREYETLFQRALITFALARTLNGAISAVQGTELALQPAGVGVTLTPGEVLDPINDLVERFSWIMLVATISLGVQQVLLDVGQWWGVRVLVALLGLAWLWFRLRKPAGIPGGRPAFEATLLRVFVVVLFIRFAVPVAMIANEALYELFLANRYQQSQQVVESAGADLERAVARDRAGGQEEGAGVPAAETSLFESLGRSLSGTREALDFGRRVDEVKRRAGEVIEHLIRLSVVFVLQTGILPIAFLWIFLQLLKRLIYHKY